VTLKEAKTLNGQKLKVEFKNAALYLNNARVTSSDVEASNGVIHVIDSVLIPKNLKPTQSLVKGKDAVSEKILVDAIDIGVDLFNAGNEKACASIYRIAVMSVLEIEPKALDKKDLSMLKKTLISVDASDDQRANAWSLRRAIDAMLSKLNK
jgi:hypothetical protein